MAQHGAEAGHVATQRALRARRRAVPPQRVDEGVSADIFIRVGRKHREDSALAGAGQGQIVAVGVCPERSEDTDVHDPR